MYVCEYVVAYVCENGCLCCEKWKMVQRCLYVVLLLFKKSWNWIVATYGLDWVRFQNVVYLCFMNVCMIKTLLMSKLIMGQNGLDESMSKLIWFQTDYMYVWTLLMVLMKACMNVCMLLMNVVAYECMYELAYAYECVCVVCIKYKQWKHV